MLTTDKFDIKALLEKIKQGEIQLPDFQREWVWKDKQIKSLLESVIRGFPINSILLLECDTNNLKFAHRSIEGAGKTDAAPQYLILDGQQRLTSLFGALFSDEPVEIKKGNKEYFYYVDMKKAIKSVKNSSDEEDLIISVPPSRKLKTKDKNLDLSTPEKEFAAGMFPLNKIFDSRKWLRVYERFHNDESAVDLTDTFNEEIIDKVSSYKFIAIKIDKDTPLEAVCKIFEKVNISGVVLTIFDLSTAILASYREGGKSISLRDDWNKISENEFKTTTLEILKDIDGTEFITALTLLVSYRNYRDGKGYVGCKRENILNIAPTDYLQYKDALADGFVDAGKFLEEEGITKIKYLPYKPQLIPMAALLAELKISDKNNAAARDKFRQWYWCGVFSETYRDGHLARFAKDIVQVMNWIESGEEPEIIKDTQVVASALIRVKSIQSAVFKGMVSMIFKNKATDFRSGRAMALSANHGENIDVHHIFPKKYCEDRDFQPTVYDSILNKTPISSETNKIIGQKAPSIYIKEFERQGNSSRQIDDSFASHFIDAALCRADDFDAFVVDRAKKILDAVENLTGLKVVGRDSPEIQKLFGTTI